MADTIATRGGPKQIPPEVRKRFLDALRKGVPVRHACALAGLARKSVYRWIERGGRGTTGQYREFAEEVAQAREEAVGTLVEDIRGHAEADHRAAKWMLSRMDPDSWGEPGKRQALEHEQQMQEIERRKADADARLAEAKAAVAEAVANDEDGRGWLVVGMAALMDHPDMPASLRAQLDEWFRRANVVEFRRKQLAGPDVETEATEG